VTTPYLAVSFRAKPGQEARVRQLLAALVAPSRADDGCLRFDFYADNEDPAHSFLYEAWRDVPAWERHTGDRAPEAVLRSVG